MFLFVVLPISDGVDIHINVAVGLLLMLVASSRAVEWVVQNAEIRVREFAQSVAAGQ